MARSTPGNYVPLDVNYARDASIRRAGPDAELLYIRGLAYAKGAKSGGHIPDYDLEVVAVGLRNVARRVAALVAANLWQVVDGGWQIRSWVPWNSANDAESAAGKLAAHVRHHVKTGKRSEDCEHCAIPPPNDAIASTTADATAPESQSDRLCKGREVVVLTSESKSQLTDARERPDDLDQIIDVLAGLRPTRTVDRAWAARIRADITNRMPDDTAHPGRYVLAAIRNEPDRYLPAALPNGLQANLRGPGTSDLARAADHARDALRAQRDANRAEVTS